VEVKLPFAAYRLKYSRRSSVSELISAIEGYIDRRNQDPTPFVWTASAKSITAKVRNAKATLSTQHWQVADEAGCPRRM